jgi:hypothetical protein
MRHCRWPVVGGQSACTRRGVLSSSDKCLRLISVRRLSFLGMSVGLGESGVPVLCSPAALACHFNTDSQYLTFSRSNFSSHFSAMMILMAPRAAVRLDVIKNWRWASFEILRPSTVEVGSGRLRQGGDRGPCFGGIGACLFVPFHLRVVRVCFILGGPVNR